MSTIPRPWQQTAMHRASTDSLVGEFMFYVRNHERNRMHLPCLICREILDELLSRARHAEA